MSLALSHPALHDIALMSKDERLGRMQRWKLSFLSFASKVTGCYEHSFCWTIFVFQGECRFSQTRGHSCRTMWLWLDFLTNSIPRATWLKMRLVKMIVGMKASQAEKTERKFTTSTTIWLAWRGQNGCLLVITWAQTLLWRCATNGLRFGLIIRKIGQGQGWTEDTKTRWWFQFFIFTHI